MPIRIFSDGHQNFVRRASEFCRVGNNHEHSEITELGWAGLSPLKTQKAASRHTEWGWLILFVARG